MTSSDVLMNTRRGRWIARLHSTVKIILHQRRHDDVTWREDRRWGLGSVLPKALVVERYLTSAWAAESWIEINGDEHVVRM